MVSLNVSFNVSGSICGVFTCINFEMDMFSLEDDEGRELFITQTPSQSQPDKLIDIINENKDEDLFGLDKACGGGNYGDVQQFADISDAEEGVTQGSDLANFE